MGHNYVTYCQFALEGVLMAAVGSIGLVGNILSLVILFRNDLHLKPTFRQLLSMLFIYDSLCIVFGVSLFSLPYLSNSYNMKVHPYIVPWVLPLAQIANTASIYSTVVVAMERYVSVCRPHTHLPYYTGTVTIVVVSLVSSLANITRWFEYEVREVSRNVTKTVNGSEVNVTLVLDRALATDLRKNPVYSQVTTSMSLLVLNLLPLVTLAVLNYKIICAIRNRNNSLVSVANNSNRDLKVAAVLVAIVVVFFVCHSFKCFINMVEFAIMLRQKGSSEAWADSMTIVMSVSHLLIISNCSVNFLLYCYKDGQFRKAVVKLLSPKFCKRRSATNVRTSLHIDETAL